MLVSSVARRQRWTRPTRSRRCWIIASLRGPSAPQRPTDPTCSRRVGHAQAGEPHIRYCLTCEFPSFILFLPSLPPLCAPLVSGSREYLIHWSGEAHLYDSWHTESELSDIVSGGFKKLTNYQRSVREFDEWRSSAAPEEVEQALVNIEMGRNEMKEWIIVERIVASRSVPTAEVKEKQRIRRMRCKRKKSTVAPQTKSLLHAPATHAASSLPLAATAATSSPMADVAASPVPETPDASVTSSVWAMAAQQMTVGGEKKENSVGAEDATTAVDADQQQMEVDQPQANGAVKEESKDDADGTQQDASSSSEDDDDDDDEYDDDDDDDATFSTLQYFVKWRGLPYEENTWEAFDDIVAYQSQIDDFVNGGSASAIAEIHNNMPGLLKKTTDKTKKVRGNTDDTRHQMRGEGERENDSGREPALILSIPFFLSRLSPSSVPPCPQLFVPLKEQPPYLIGGELRNYQLDGLNWMAYSWSNNINGILADEMGLGKTVQCISLLAFLAVQRGLPGPFLVVAPLSTVASWQRECAKWASFLNTVVYVGSKKSRDIIREYEFYSVEKPKGTGRQASRAANARAQIRFNILITTYEFVLADRVHLGKITWQYLMVDEGEARALLALAWDPAGAAAGRWTRPPLHCICLVLLLMSALLCCPLSACSSSPEGLLLVALPNPLRVPHRQPSPHHRQYVHDGSSGGITLNERSRTSASPVSPDDIIADFSACRCVSSVSLLPAPLQNTLKELWCLLHFLEPEKFGSLDEFEERYSGITEGEGVGDLHALLLPHLFRRTKKDVLKSLPPKHERILAVDMAPMQRKYYRWIIRGNFRELNRGVKGKKSQLTNICMELRKCTNSPLLFPRAQIDEAMASEHTAAAIAQLNAQTSGAAATTDSAAVVTAPAADDGASPTSDAAAAVPAGPTASTVVFSGVEPGSQLDSLIRCSGKMILLDKLLLKLKATGHRCLIFSQMVRMIDILSEYMNLRGFLHQRLDGSMSSGNRQRSMDHFNAPGSPDFAFLLSTRAGGL